MAKTKKDLENQLLRLLNLPPDVTIDGSSISLNTETITLGLPNPRERVCPHCGGTSCIVRGSGRWQELRHFPINNRSVVLRIFKRRLFCPDCGSSFYESPEWAIPRLRMTTALFRAIFMGFKKMLNFTSIMDLYKVGENTVRSVFDAIEIRHPAELPETMCIDEFHADTGYYMQRRRKWATDDYNVNLTDWRRRVVIDVLQQKNLVFLSKHFKRHYSKHQRSRVRFFVCDMAGSFISLARNCFPDALICIDNFHVVRLLENATVNVRVRSQNRARDNGREEDYRLLKHLHYLLVTKELNQEARWGTRYAEKRQRLDAAFDIAPDLEEAYNALQHFHDILDSHPFSVQERELAAWYEEYRRTSVNELRTAVMTIHTYRGYILNAWRCSRSNGPCEGLNKKIKDVKRSMFGAHSFENFRKRVLLSCGSLDLDDPQLILHLERRCTK